MSERVCDGCGDSLAYPWRLIGSRIVCSGCEIVHRGRHASYVSARRGVALDCRGALPKCACVACVPVGGVL